MDVLSYIKAWNQDKTDRLTTENEWQRVADYCFPRRDFTTTRSPGENRRKKIYDSTGIRSVLMLASALHANLTPVQTKWFFFKSNEDTREYWDDVQLKMLGIFSSPDSKFALQAHELYLDMAAFGTAVMGVFNRNGVMVFKTLNLADCWIRENQYGVVDTLKYCQKYTADRMISEFGIENVHKNVKDAFEKQDGSTKFTVLYCVGPRIKNLGRGAVSKDKPFYAAYIDVDNKVMIGEESGFDDFPFVAPRISKRSGETYGYGFGMQAISEIVMLNEMTEVMFRAAAKNTDPPILSPIDSAVLPYRLDPGGINFYDPDVGTPEFWSNNFQPGYLSSLIESKRADIEKIFFIDWMTLPDNDRMTATETLQRAQDSLRNMSPVNSRAESEFLSEIIRRVYLLGIEMGKFNPPPESDQNSDVKIEYISPLAMAQKSVSASSILQGLSSVAQLAQFDPRITKIIDSEAAARDQLLNTYFLPSSYVRSSDEYNKLLEQEEQAQSAVVAAQGAEQYASAAKDGADAFATLSGL